MELPIRHSTIAFCTKYIQNVLTSFQMFILVSLISPLHDMVLAVNIDRNLSLIIPGPSGSYFGYTVALLQSQDKPRFIVGAPKSNTTFYPEPSAPGAVYKCTLDAKCEELYHEYDRRRRYSLAGQLLGGSLAVDETTNRIAVCGSRWGVVMNFRGLHLIQGSCHEYGFDLFGNQTFYTFYYPTPPPKKRKKGTSIFYRGMAQAGFSVHFLKHNNKLLFGAPGLNDWRGGYVLMDNTTAKLNILTILDDTYHVNSATGYSISSGRFSSEPEVYYVAGSPTADNNGKVYIFSLDEKLVETLHGEQFMSRFGATVCVSDLNRDTYDDLLVGAPMYSEYREEGRVYVYESKGQGVRLKLKSILEGGNRVGGQFGTTIGNIGDINNDGYTDFAIGAPLADEHRGAIYIYLGGPPGLENTHAQEILGRHVSDTLLGFGQSISNPMDIDKNNVTDFAVGAFLSDHVVFLRTRPVANVVARLESSRDQVNAKEKRCLYKNRVATCVDVYVKFLYLGKYVPKYIDIEYVLRADTEPNESIESSRAGFRQGDGVVPVIRRNVTLEHGRAYNRDFSHSVVILARKDIFTDVKFDLEYSLQTSCSTTKQCSLTPVLSEDKLSSKELHVGFAKNCKKSICESDLSLKALVVYADTYNTRQLILTPQSTLTLKITLVNRKEPAYLATVYIKHHSSLTIHHLETIEGKRNVQCQVLRTDQSGDDKYKTAGIECLTGNPLANAETSSFLLALNAGKFIGDGNTTNIIVRAQTHSFEKNDTLADNYVNIAVILKRHVVLNLTCFSSPEQISYGGYEMHLKADNNKPSLNYSKVPLTQRVRLRNTGRSYMGGCDVMFIIPALTLEGKEVFSLSAVEVESDDIDVYGSCAYPEPNVHVPCNTSQWQCIAVECLVEAVRPDAEVDFIIRGHVYEETLALIQSKSLKFETFVAVKLHDDPLLTMNSQVHAEAVIVTSLYRRLSQHMVIPIWMYFIGALAGVGALVLIVALFWKCGFFKRRWRCELQKLRERHTEATEPLNPADELAYHDDDDDDDTVEDIMTDHSEPPLTPHHLDDVDESTLTRSTQRDNSFVFSKPDGRVYGNTTYFMTGEMGTRV